MARNARNETSIQEDTSFKLDEVSVLAVRPCKLADGWSLPAVDRDLEGHARRQAGYEAGHDWYARSMKERELGVGHHMARDPELLERYLRISTTRK